MSGQEDIPADFLADFAVMCRDETRLDVVSTRYRLWCLMAAVQLAARHPSARQTETLQTAIEMARAIQGMLGTTPALARIAEQGWDLSDAMEPR